MSKVESTFSNNIVMFKALEIRGPSTDSDSCKINLNFILKKGYKIQRVLTVKNKVTEGSNHQWGMKVHKPLTRAEYWDGSTKSALMLPQISCQTCTGAEHPKTKHN